MLCVKRRGRAAESRGDIIQCKSDHWPKAGGTTIDPIILHARLRSSFQAREAPGYLIEVARRHLADYEGAATRVAAKVSSSSTVAYGL